MKPVVFSLQILSPDPDAEVLMSVTSAQPLMLPQYGDLIDPAGWQPTSGDNDVLRVVRVRHLLEDADSLTHIVCIHTEASGEPTERQSEKQQQWSSAVAKIRDRARGIAGEAPALGRRGMSAVERQLPRIKSLVENKVGPLARKTIEDDEAMTQTFAMVYEFLPTTLRLMMQQDTFVDFCLRNRTFLIERLDQDQTPVIGGTAEQNAPPPLADPAATVYPAPPQ